MSIEKDIPTTAIHTFSPCPLLARKASIAAMILNSELLSNCCIGEDKITGNGNARKLTTPGNLVQAHQGEFSREQKLLLLGLE